MKVTGEFEIYETFEIPNIGIVLTGKMISEKNSVKINEGASITFKFNDEKITRKIKGYETGFGKSLSSELFHLRNIGILIECESELEIESLKKWKPEKEKAEIIR